MLHVKFNLLRGLIEKGIYLWASCRPCIGCASVGLVSNCWMKDLVLKMSQIVRQMNRTGSFCSRMERNDEINMFRGGEIETENAPLTTKLSCTVIFQVQP